MVRLFFVIILIINSLYAQIKATVDSSLVQEGDVVTYSLQLNSDKVKKIDIKKLCDVDILSKSSNTSISIINGATSKNYTVNYSFIPQKSCTIEPIAVEIEGKVEYSNPIEIEVLKSQDVKDTNFILKLESLQKSVYLGEKFEAELTFKQKKGSLILDSEFIAPSFNDFWVKNEAKPQKYDDGEYSITKIVYTLSAKKTGKLVIPKALIKIASKSNQEIMQGFFIPRVNWKSYYSNDLEVDVKELPNDTMLIGDFSIKTVLDKNQTDADEPIHLTIEVEGDGNLEDIKSFEPKIEGVSIYSEKSYIEGAKLMQNITFVYDKDFTIPPFSLRFFSPSSNEIKEISTEPIDIKIKTIGTKTINVKRESAESQVSSSSNMAFLLPIITFFIGLIVGILGMFYRGKLIVKKVKKSLIKEPKVLLAKLLPHKDDIEAREIIEILEKNIYQNQNIEIDKKALNNLLKKLG